MLGSFSGCGNVLPFCFEARGIDWVQRLRLLGPLDRVQDPAPGPSCWNIWFWRKPDTLLLFKGTFKLGAERFDLSQVFAQRVLQKTGFDSSQTRKTSRCLQPGLSTD